MNVFRNVWIKCQVWLGLAVDISDRNSGPSALLSNLSNNHFCFDGVECRSMEGFLQSLKRQDGEKQRHLCSLDGREAKGMATHRWRRSQIVWWKGKVVDRQSTGYLHLVRHAYEAMLEQNSDFRNALLATGRKRLYCSQLLRNPFKTILTEQEFCSILTRLRREAQQGGLDKNANFTPPIRKTDRWKSQAAVWGGCILAGDLPMHC